MPETTQKAPELIVSTAMVECYPGEPELGLYAAQNGLVSVIFYPSSSRSATFTNGGFGFGGTMTLLCDDDPVNDSAPFTEILSWTPLVITARIPPWIDCGHEVPSDYDYPPGPPPWTYHIRIDASVGSPPSTMTYQTGSLWVVGGPGSGYPPYHG